MKKFRLLAIAAAFAFAASASPLPAQQLQDGASVNGHIVVAGVPPVGTGCTIAAGSTDTAGSCLTTATSGSIAFAKAFLTAPHCGVWDASSVSATSMPVWTETTAQITLTTVITAHQLRWLCVGKSGN